MRDLLMLALMLPALALALRNAFAAFVLWGWASTFGPQSYLYGFMVGVSYVQWFAIIALVLLLLKKDPQMRAYSPNDPLSVLLFLFAAHACIVASLAYSGLPRNMEIFSNLLKVILYALLLPMLVTSRQRLIVLLMAITFGLATHGAIEGLKFISSAGGHISQGNARLGDRNHYALFVVMGLPLLVFLFSQMKHLVARVVIGGTIFVNILAVVSTQSRGGLVALMGVGLWLVLRTRRKLLSLVLVGLGVLVVFSYAPEKWFERMDTMNEVGADSSFMGRVEAWKRASAIAVEHPLVGGGFHSVQASVIFEKYRFRQGLLGFVETPEASFARAAHSIYFEVMGDMGFTGLALFLGIMFTSFISVSKVRRMVRDGQEHNRWALELAAMLNVSMVAYLVGGASVSMGYVDLPYILVAIAAVLPRLLSTQPGPEVAKPRAMGSPRAA